MNYMTSLTRDFCLYLCYIANYVSYPVEFNLNFRQWSGRSFSAKILPFLVLPNYVPDKFCEIS